MKLMIRILYFSWSICKEYRPRYDTCLLGEIHPNIKLDIKFNFTLVNVLTRMIMMGKPIRHIIVLNYLYGQWFGNLVTPQWWDHLWLNEGFATYMMFLAVDAVLPEWKIVSLKSSSAFSCKPPSPERFGLRFQYLYNIFMI